MSGPALPRPLAALMLVLSLLPASLHVARAQGLGLRTEVRLTTYLSASHWRGEGDLLGGGLAFDRGLSPHIAVFTDLGIARLSSGCPAGSATACPKTAWHVLGGLRASPASPRARLRPHLGLALGRQDLISTASVLRGEANADAHLKARLAIRFGVSYTTSLRRQDVRLWEVAAGLNFPL